MKKNDLTPLVDKELMLWLSKPEAIKILQYLSLMEDFDKRVTDITLELNLLQSSVTKMILLLKNKGIVTEKINGRSAYLAPNRKKIFLLLNVIEAIAKVMLPDDEIK